MKKTKDELISIAAQEGLSTEGAKANLASRILGEEDELELEPDPLTFAKLMKKTKDELISIAAQEGLSTEGAKANLVSRILGEEDELELEPEQEPAPIPPPPNIPPPPSLPPPPRIPSIPTSPKIPSIRDNNVLTSASKSQVNYWPWDQQEEWPDRKVALTVKSAMEAARAKNTAQATILIDEVGPHLGERTKLIYPIGALLQRIGRSQSVDKMLAMAEKMHPNDSNVRLAKSKLRS